MKSWSMKRQHENSSGAQPQLIDFLLLLTTCAAAFQLSSSAVCNGFSGLQAHQITDIASDLPAIIQAGFKHEEAEAIAARRRLLELPAPLAGCASTPR